MSRKDCRQWQGGGGRRVVVHDGEGHTCPERTAGSSRVAGGGG